MLSLCKPRTSRRSPCSVGWTDVIASPVRRDPVIRSRVVETRGAVRPRTDAAVRQARLTEQTLDTYSLPLDMFSARLDTGMPAMEASLVAVEHAVEVAIERDSLPGLRRHGGERQRADPAQRAQRRVGQLHAAPGVGQEH